MEDRWHRIGLDGGDGKLFFTGNDGSTGRELYVSDGTAAGTSMVTELNPGAAHGVPNDLAVFWNGYYYFDGTDGATGRQLYRSDGTEGGTELVQTIHPGGADYLYDFRPAQDQLFFAAAFDDRGENNPGRSPRTKPANRATMAG